MRKKKFEELVRSIEIDIENDKDLVVGGFIIPPLLLMGGYSIENVLKIHNKRIKNMKEQIEDLQSKIIKALGTPKTIIFDDLEITDHKREINKLKFIIKQNLKIDPDEYDLVTENKTEVKLVKKDEVKSEKKEKANV